MQSRALKCVLSKKRSGILERVQKVVRLAVVVRLIMLKFVTKINALPKREDITVSDI